MPLSRAPLKRLHSVLVSQDRSLLQPPSNSRILCHQTMMRTQGLQLRQNSTGRRYRRHHVGGCLHINTLHTQCVHVWPCSVASASKFSFWSTLYAGLMTGHPHACMDLLPGFRLMLSVRARPCRKAKDAGPVQDLGILLHSPVAWLPSKYRTTVARSSTCSCAGKRCCRVQWSARCCLRLTLLLRRQTLLRRLMAGGHSALQGHHTIPNFVSPAEEAALLALVDTCQPAWQDSNFNGKHRWEPRCLQSPSASPAVAAAQHLRLLTRSRPLSSGPMCRVYGLCMLLTDGPRGPDQRLLQRSQFAKIKAHVVESST